MTSALAPELPATSMADTRQSAPPDTMWRQVLRSRRVLIGGGILLTMALLCVATLPWTLSTHHTSGSQGIARYQAMNPDKVRHPPAWSWHSAEGWFGYDTLGRSVLVRSLLGGTISLAVGLAAAAIAVLLGVVVGLVAGFRGGWIDAFLMRFVDIMYGLPYVLLVILFKIAFEQPLVDVFKLSTQSASLIVLFSAIGLVSWLTMSRVVRGQVLSLRSQPFIEACRAMGLKQRRIFLRHILPNLVGPITVYATLTVPSAILQESFLSFLGIGVNKPLATWGSLAGEGVEQLSPLKFYWWLLLFPCTLLATTLLSLNFLGDGLRDVFDPKKEAAKI